MTTGMVGLWDRQRWFDKTRTKYDKKVAVRLTDARRASLQSKKVNKIDGTSIDIEGTSIRIDSVIQN